MAQITLNSTGVASSGSLVLQSNGTTTAVTIDASQNVGLGVTPSAWNSNYKAIEMSFGALTGNTTGVEMNLTSNVYRATDGSYKYLKNGVAGMYSISDGSARGMTWYTAASGTAGGTISFTQAMTLDASGNLGVGATSPAHKIEASSSTNNYIGVTCTTDGNAASRFKNNQRDWLVGVLGGASGAWAVYDITASAERARIDSSGNFSVTGTITSGKGADVASAGSMTLGTGNFFDITGTTTISNIAIKPAGTVVYLKFAASLSLQTGSVGTSGALRLTGGATLGVTQYDVLMLISDGTNWWQVAVNSN
jgi:hypothetical protein